MNTLNSSSNNTFMPRDDELLQNFLYKKVNNKPIPNHPSIIEHDLFGTKKNPCDIWKEFEASYSYGGKDLYFFTTLKKKSATSTRNIRTIGNGNWEGEDTGKRIFTRDTNKLLGMKKRFRFEKSNTPQDGGWILHEYNLDKSLINNPLANNYVLCRFRKNLKPELQNTQESIDDQSLINSRTKNCVAQVSKRKIVIPKQTEAIIPKQPEAAISDNNARVRKYIIYEEPINPSNCGKKRKYEDNIEYECKGEERKYIRSTWSEEKRFRALRATFESEYNDIFFGKNIDQNPKNPSDSKNNIMNKEEEEEEDGMSWREFFAKQWLEIKKITKEDDIQMIANSFHNDNLLGNYII